MISFRTIFRPLILAILFALVSNVGVAMADANFKKWISDFYSVAAQSGISKNTYNAVFAGITKPDAEVLKSANYQLRQA